MEGLEGSNMSEFHKRKPSNFFPQDSITNRQYNIVRITNTENGSQGHVQQNS